MENLRDRLRESTASLHAQVEDCLSFQKMDLSSYVEVLEVFYRFYLNFERSLNPFLSHKVLQPLSWEERRKVPWLEQDLLALRGGLDQSEIPVLLKLESAFEALGSLYVVEGSMLGGQVISRLLKERFDLNAQNGARFFQGYQQDTGMKWRSFLQLLEGHSKEEELQILKGAERTFSTLLDAFKFRSPTERTMC